MLPSKLSIDLVFPGQGYETTDVDQAERFMEFCAAAKGNVGYMDIYIGERSNSNRQKRFFFGPVIDAFVEVTGMPDRLWWEAELKRRFHDKYFVRSNPLGEEYTVGIRALSMRQMWEFITDVLNVLYDMGGNLAEWAGGELLEITKSWDEYETKRAKKGGGDEVTSDKPRGGDQEPSGE